MKLTRAAAVEPGMQTVRTRGVESSDFVRHSLLHPRLADHDDANDWGLSYAFNDKQLSALLRGKLLCFCHNHESQVGPISINDSNGISEIRESAWYSCTAVHACLTFRLPDLAPVMSAMQLRRDHGVRCSRLIRR